MNVYIYIYLCNLLPFFLVLLLQAPAVLHVDTDSETEHDWEMMAASCASISFWVIL